VASSTSLQMSLLRLRNVAASQLHRTTMSTMRLHSMHTRVALRSATPPAPSNTPAAAASTAAEAAVPTPAESLSAGSRALAASHAKLLEEQIEQLRQSRRSRLWLVALITGTATVVTAYRSVMQGREQEAELQKLKATWDSEKVLLAQAQQEYHARQAKVSQLLNAAAPQLASQLKAASVASPASSSVAAVSTSSVVAPAAAWSGPFADRSLLEAAPSTAGTAAFTPQSTAAVVPTSFLSAAVLDVQRTVRLAPRDERVQLAPEPAKIVPAGEQQPPAPKPRRAIIMA
jgi:hypothetical protein